MAPRLVAELASCQRPNAAMREEGLCHRGFSQQYSVRAEIDSSSQWRLLGLSALATCNSIFPRPSNASTVSLLGLQSVIISFPCPRSIQRSKSSPMASNRSARNKRQKAVEGSATGNRLVFAELTFHQAGLWSGRPGRHQADRRRALSTAGKPRAYSTWPVPCISRWRPGSATA